MTGLEQYLLALLGGIIILSLFISVIIFDKNNQEAMSRILKDTDHELNIMEVTKCNIN